MRFFDYLGIIIHEFFTKYAVYVVLIMVSYGNDKIRKRLKSFEERVDTLESRIKSLEQEVYSSER